MGKEASMKELRKWIRGGYMPEGGSGLEYGLSERNIRRAKAVANPPKSSLPSREIVIKAE